MLYYFIEVKNIRKPSKPPFKAFLLSIVASIILTPSAVRATTKSKICFVTTAGINVSVDALREGYLFGGATLAFHHFKRRNPHSSISMKHIQVLGNDVALLATLNSSNVEECRVVTGLITSRESLLATPILIKKGIFTFSSSASHTALEEYSGNFLTIANSAVDYISAMAVEARKIDSSIFIIRRLEDHYSELYAKGVMSLTKEKAKILTLGTDGLISQKQHAEIAAASNATVVFTTLALPSVPILTHLISNWPQNTPLKVIGSPSWALDPITFTGRKLLLRKDVEIVLPASFDFGSKKYKKLTLEFKALNKVSPHPNAAYAYDATAIALQCLLLRPNDINACARKTDFTGWTGRIRYDKESVFPKRKVNMFPISTFLSRME